MVLPFSWISTLFELHVKEWYKSLDIMQKKKREEKKDFVVGYVMVGGGLMVALTSQCYTLSD